MIDRASFLRRGAAAAALGLGAPGSARAAAPPVTPREDDLGLLQFTATAKLVCLAFLDRATVLGGPLDTGRRRTLRALRAADAQHLRRLRFTLAADAPRRTDFRIVLPDAAFGSRTAVAEQGETLEALTSGVCLIAAAAGRDPGTRELLTRIMAADQGHLATYRTLRGRPAARTGLPQPLDFEQAGSALDAYLEPSS